MGDIVTVTMNPAVDKSTATREVVAEDKLRCAPPRLEPGGGGLNVSRVVKRLGGASVAFYPAGGYTGALLRDLLDAEGIAHRPIETRGETRENLTVLGESSGKQYRFVMPGPELRESEWRDFLARLQDGPRAKYLVASGSLPPGVPEDFYARLGRVAKRLDARYVVDCHGPPLRWAAREGVFLLKPNARELAALTGESFETEQDQERLARRVVQEWGCTSLVLSLGAAGVLLVTCDQTRRIRSPSVPIRSKVGAGDSMVGAIVVALMRGAELLEAVQYGVAAGAAAVMTPGTELCRKEDVDRLYEQIRRE